MKPDTPSIVEFATDSQLLGLSLSSAQETLLRAMHGMSLTVAQRRIWQECTGLTRVPAEPFGEVTVISGARSGKDSRIAAPVVCYEAVFGKHEAHLSKGERGVITLVAQDQRGTRVAFGYVRDYLTRSSLLASRVSEVLTSEVTLTNGLTIACFPCTMRSLRGWSIPVAVLDEVGFYRLEGQADSDVEVQASVRRGMLGFPNARLVKVSTPYMRSGILWDDFQRFGQENPVSLIWRASTRTMHPGLHLRLEAMRLLDPSRYAREYEAEFAEDVDAFLPAAWVEDAVQAGRHELPPREGMHYVAAADPSGGGRDPFTLAVVHVEGTGPQARVIQDVMKGWTRLGSRVGDAVPEIAQILKRYGVREITADRYAAGWTRQAFEQAGLAYREAPMDKSAIYLEAEPLFAQGRVELLDHPQLTRELRLLERRPRAGGKTLVDHPRAASDDFANSLCLAAVQAVAGAGVTVTPEMFQFFGVRATSPAKIFLTTPATEPPRHNTSDRPWDPGVLDDPFNP